MMPAINAAWTVFGTWKIDDDGYGAVHFLVGSSISLTQISKGWVVTSQNNSEMRFHDDDSLHTEEVHFKKTDHSGLHSPKKINKRF
ncbi:hypothetical protein BH11BAC1_BH11BAC1_13390 [soil metagenome]